MKKNNLIWLILTLLIFSVVVWASFRFYKVEQSISLVDNKSQRTIVEKQAIYTTIQGIPGLRGEPGRDSFSTHTIVEKEKTIVEQEAVAGEKGDTGADGKTLELAYDESGKLLYRYIGDRVWQQVLPLGGGGE